MKTPKRIKYRDAEYVHVADDKMEVPERVANRFEQEALPLLEELSKELASSSWGLLPGPAEKVRRYLLSVESSLEKTIEILKNKKFRYRSK